MDNISVTLELLTGDKAGTMFRMSSSIAVMGRSNDVDISLPFEKSLSRRHSRFEIRDDSLWVIDMGSSNGTRVEDVPVSEQVLVNGNVVTAGKVKLKVKIEPVSQLPDVHTPAHGEPAITEPGPGADITEQPYVPAGDLAGLEGAAQYSDEDVKRGRSALLRLILGVAFLIVLIYAVQILSNIKPSVDRKHHYVIRKSDDLLLSLRGRESFNDSDVIIKDGNGTPVVSWRRYNGLIESGFLKNLIVVTGKAQGDAEITVKDGSDVRGHFVVHVRGIVPRDWDEDSITTDQARRLAEKKENEAKIFATTEPYEATKRLEEAAELYLRAGDGYKSEEIMNEHREIERGLTLRLTRLYDEARDKIVAPMGVRKDPEGAIQILSEIKRQVPDEQSIDWQLADMVESIARGQLPVSIR